MSDFRREAHPRARKKHPCDLCGSTIDRGETYVYISERYCGEFYEYSYHENCYGLIARYGRTRDYGDEYDDDMVLCDIRDRVCISCDKFGSCGFGFQKTPLCPKVQDEYLRTKDVESEE